MDAHQLHELFTATLDPSNAIRNNAEIALRSSSFQPQFINNVLRIVMEPQVNNAIRIAAAVYLKNKCSREWNAEVDGHVLAQEDKQAFMRDLLEALPLCSLQIRQILLRVVGIIIGFSFPDAWPELLPAVATMLSRTEPEYIYTGFSIFLQLSKHFRWSMKSGYDEMLLNALPAIVGITESIANESNPVAGLICYDFTKIIKMAIARSIPTAMQDEQLTRRVITILLHIVYRPLPDYVFKIDPADRESDAWCKAKKWASFCLLRLEVKYVVSKQRKITEPDTAVVNFKRLYKQEFLVKVTDVALEQLREWSSGELWLPSTVLCNLLGHFEQVSDTKRGWAMIETHADMIVSSIIYRLLCPGQDQLELFEDDPVEYVHRTIEIYPDTAYADTAASNLLAKIAQKRKGAFTYIVDFIQQVFANIPDNSIESACRMIGGIRMLQTLSPIILSKPNDIPAQMEMFLRQFIVPCFESPHGILRSRICQLICAFAQIMFENRETLFLLYDGILKCLSDDNNLPVQVEAAMTLQALNEYDDIQSAMKEHVQGIVGIILALTKKIDLESLLNVLDDLINTFPDEISPLAAEMEVQLRDHFLSIAAEVKDASDQSPEDYDFNSVTEDKIAAGLGILRSLTGLGLSLQNNRSLIVELSQNVLPILNVVYCTEELTEFFAETFVLHENILFTLKEIPAEYWDILQLCLQGIHMTGYLEFMEAAPVFENYIAYGGDVLANNKSILGLFVGLISDTVSGVNANIAIDEKTSGLMLGQRLFCTEALRNKIDEQDMALLLQVALERLMNDPSHVAAVHVYSYNLSAFIMSAIINNSAMAIRILASKNAIPTFMNHWLQSKRELSRVDDLKIQELTILSLITLGNDEFTLISDYVPQLLEFLALALESMPAAVERREELSRQDLEGSTFDDGLDYEEDWEPEDDGSESDDDDDDPQNTQFENTQFIATSDPSMFDNSASNAMRTFKFEMYEPDDFKEDLYSVSPLENIDAYAVLKETLQNLATSHPERYNILMSMMNENDKASLMESASRAA